VLRESCATDGNHSAVIKKRISENIVFFIRKIFQGEDRARSSELRNVNKVVHGIEGWFFIRTKLNFRNRMETA
jgi:hypothetical protein